MSRKDRRAREMNLEAEEAAPEMEASAEEAEAPQQAAPVKEVAHKKAASPKVDFDAWFAMRGPKIPPQHHKEVVKADFKGRGLGQHESLEDFDAALRKYGVKLV